MSEPKLRLLEVHGTKLMELRPSSIWNAAMADLDRHEHNRLHAIDDNKHFAFHRKHVAGAFTANDIIRAAIADPEPGRKSHKAGTRLLYSDLELLRRSLA